MPKLTVKIIPEADNNTITFSKNFRIFSTADALENVQSLVFFDEDVEVPSPNTSNLGNINRSFRWSKNKIDWSLWYTFSPTDISSISSPSLMFDPTALLYIEVKYEYDDGSFEELESPLLINEVKFRFNTKAGTSEESLIPNINCTGERCPALIFDRQSTFRPYEVDAATSIFKELSFHTNEIFGHQVVYFRTEPDPESGDYVFKEWTLHDNVARKCIKVLVDQNNFPHNKPNYSEYGIDFEMPFEIHIDHKYFQSIFGNDSEPRRRDFLYFPLVNRMYEIQGSYLYRSFMMEPVYWRIQLTKFHPNIDMLMDPENRDFLDNLIVSGEELLRDEINEDIEDGTMPQQYSTISKKFDPTRRAIHPDLKIKTLNFFFNFASLIDNYYDLSGIPGTLKKYEITNDSPLKRETVETVEAGDPLDPSNPKTHLVIRAYEGSDIFKTWANNALITGDKNASGSITRFIRVRGPFDTLPDHIGQSESGRYLQIEAYKDLSFTKQRDILTIIDFEDNKLKVPITIRDTAVIYNETPIFNADTNCNLTYTFLFNVPDGSDRIDFIKGFDVEEDAGVHIYATFANYIGDSGVGDLTINIVINDTTKTHVIPNFTTGEWKGLIISLSNEFGQHGVFVYDIVEDEADADNHLDFTSIYTKIDTLAEHTFNIEQQYNIPSSNALLANLRIFNTMIKEEQHDFVLSQLFIKDESMLQMIDNCRVQLNVPFLSKNK